MEVVATSQSARHKIPELKYDVIRCQVTPNSHQLPTLEATLAGADTTAWKYMLNSFEFLQVLWLLRPS